MAAVLSEDWTSVAAGDDPATASGWTLAGGSGGVTYVVAPAFAGGTRAARYGTTGQSGALVHTLPGPSRTYLSFYFRCFGDLPSPMFVAYAGAGPQSPQLRVNGGRWQLRDAFAAVATGVRDVIAGTWYRLEWTVDTAAGTQTLEVFEGGNMHGAVPDERLAGAYTRGAPDALQLGPVSNPSSSPSTCDYARIRVRTDQMAAPHGGGTPAPNPNVLVVEDWTDLPAGTDPRHAPGWGLDLASFGRREVIRPAYAPNTSAARYVADDGRSGAITRSVRPVADLRVQWYWRWSGPRAPVLFVAYAGDEEQAAQLRLRNGRWQLRDELTAVATGKAPVPPDVWFRVQWRIRAGVQTLAVYSGGNLHGTTPDETIEGPFSFGPPDRVRFGPAANPGDAIYAQDFARIRARGDRFADRPPTPPVPPSPDGVWIWDGSLLTAAKPGVWDGTTVRAGRVTVT